MLPFYDLIENKDQHRLAAAAIPSRTPIQTIRSHSSETIVVTEYTLTGRCLAYCGGWLLETIKGE